MMWKHPVVELRHFITAAFVLVVALGWYKLRWVGFYALLGPFERVAPISYGRAQALEGIVKARPYGTAKKDGPKRRPGRPKGSRVLRALWYPRRPISTLLSAGCRLMS